MVKNTCSKCGNDLEESRIGKNRYCKLCHAEWMRLNRPKHSQLKDDSRKKANVRSYANVYEKRGTLIKQPCEICGNPNAEKHHEDYLKPLEVKWFCRQCHLEYHKQKTHEFNEAA